MKKSTRAERAICASLVSALALGATSWALVPNLAYAAPLTAQGTDIGQSPITFTDDAVTIPEGTSGVEAKGTDVTISEPGTYVFQGSCANGSISVKKGIQDVTIVLSDLTLSKDADKAIKFKAGSSGSIVVEGTCNLSTTNDKGIIKANALADDNDNLILDTDGHTTGGDLTISGTGTLHLSSSYQEYVEGELEGADAINCEGDLTVVSGTYVIDVTDDAMHADNTLTIGQTGLEGPTIEVRSATEGLEGASVYLLSGTGTINTSDDGVNAANADLVSYGWHYTIGIEGGTWRVVAGGDALDSNGDLTISGGSTEAYCTASGNGAVDYGEGAEGEVRGSFTVSNATLLAVGNDMMVTPTSGVYALFGGMGQGGQPGPQGQGGQPGQQGQGFPGGQGGSLMAQSQGSQVVLSGQSTTIASGESTLFSTTAAASGAYALFSAPGITASSELTLTSGTQGTTAVTGEGGAGSFGMGGQMPQGFAPNVSQGSGGQAPQSAGSETSSYAATGSANATNTTSTTSPTYSTSTTTTATTAASAVRRLSGAGRYDTMAAAVKSAFSSSTWAIVASGEGFADALAASALAGTHACPVILTSPTALSAQAKDLILDLGVTHVQIVGGTAAVSAAVESEISSLVDTVERIAGQDRYETSLKVFDAVKAQGGSLDSVIIATGANYADALSIGSWAWNTASPIVLVAQGGSLSSSALSRISASGISKATIVGGDAAVPSSVETALAGLRVASTRLGGANRYETSARIAEWVTSNGLAWKSAVFASGQNFPDALVASAMAGKLGAPVLLADATNTTTIALAGSHEAEIGSALILGGTSAVSSAVEASLTSTLS